MNSAESDRVNPAAGANQTAGANPITGTGGAAETSRAARIRPALGQVQETLLIPVYARAVESAREEPIFYDAKSLQMVEQIDYDFARFAAAKHVLLDVTVRTALLDRLVGQFIADNPAGQVINLGAGLDSRFCRLDNGQIHWIDLDMPDSIALREQFFPALPRVRQIAKSMFDIDWTEQLFDVPGEQTLLVAEGLFMYFQPAQIQQFVCQLAERLPGANLLFQSISPAYVGRQSRVPGVRETAATFGWGVRCGKELEAWDPRIEFIDEWFLVDQFPHRWGRLRWLAKIPYFGREVRRVMKFSQLRFATGS